MAAFIRTEVIMNEHQKTAYLKPCFEAEETTNQIFKRYRKVRGGFISVILTANIGLEWAQFFGGVPLWHTSVALIKGDSLLPVQVWKKKDKKLALDTLISTLSGVGDESRKHLTVATISYQLRRPMTEVEAAGLPRKGKVVNG
jgi:hypothetical protein